MPWSSSISSATASRLVLSDSMDMLGGGVLLVRMASRTTASAPSMSTFMNAGTPNRSNMSEKMTVSTSIARLAAPRRALRFARSASVVPQTERRRFL